MPEDILLPDRRIDCKRVAGVWPFVSRKSQIAWIFREMSYLRLHTVASLPGGELETKRYRLLYYIFVGHSLGRFLWRHQSNSKLPRESN